MAISVNWPTGVINIPRADLTLIQSSPTEIRELDINWFRLTLKDLEDDPDGMPFPKTHKHNTEVEVGGLTLARVVEILPPYTITFEDGQYAVNLVGANSNIGDRVNVNQVSIRSQNSAGMISSPEIEYASFNGGVSYDEANGYSGTIYPVGTPRKPVNNIIDAQLIAEYRGFTTGYIIGDATFTADTDVEKFTFYGTSRDITHVHIDDAASVDDCIFNNMHVTGYLDGNSRLIECMIDNIEYIKGKIEQCLLEPGTIKISSGGVAYILDCWTGHTVTMDNLPTIDMNGAGQSLVVRNHNGSLKIINKTGPDTITMSLDGGSVFIDLNTVTDGYILIDGVGAVVNAVTRETLFTGTYGDLHIQNSTISNKTISSSVLDEPSEDHLVDGSIGANIYDISYTEKFIYINTELSTNGNGKSSSPFNNIADAVDYAESVGWKKLMFLADATLERTLKNFTIEGIGLPTIDFNGQNVDKSEFIKVKLTGTQVGSITAREVILLDGLSGINGVYKEIGIAGDVILSNPSNTVFASASSFATGTPPGHFTINLGTGSGNVIFNGRKLSANILLKNCNDSNRVATFEFSGGQLILDDTNTDGKIGVAGLPVSALMDNSNGSVVNTLGLFPSNATIEEAIWGSTDGISVKQNIEFLKDIEGGKWEIVGNQMIFYKSDNITEVARFDLFDSSGSPSEMNIVKRQRV